MVNKKKARKEERRRNMLAAASRATRQPGAPAAAPAAVQPAPSAQGRNASPIGAVASGPSPNAYRSPVQETAPQSQATAVAPQLMPEQVIRRPEDPHPAPGQPGFARFSGVENAVVPPRPPPAEEEHVLRPQGEADEIPIADVTVVLYSGGAAPHYVARQLQALRTQTVRPAHLWVHVDGPTGHDDKTLAPLVTFRTQVRLGRYFRVALARNVTTRFVAILDEDTLPGPRWLERALAELAQADPNAELPFGGAVIAASGGLLMADDPTQSRTVGPEFPTYDPMLVDFGRQAWVFDTDLTDVFESLRREGGGALAFSFAMAAAASAARLATVVLGYGTDRRDWPAREASAVSDPVEDILTSYQHYRAVWHPEFVGANAAAPSPIPTAPSAPTAPPPAQPPVQAPAPPPAAAPPAAGPPPLLPAAPAAPPSAPQGAVAQAIAGQGSPSPIGQPSSDPGAKPLVAPPDATVTKNGDSTQVEWVLSEDERTPDPQNERVLAPEERTPEQNNERVLQPHEQTQTTGMSERVLQPHEQTRTSGQKEWVVGSSPPPAQERVNENPEAEAPTSG